jgi:hypothetical protein
MLPEADLVLGKGFHLDPRAKIDRVYDRTDDSLCEMDSHLPAVVTPGARLTEVPSFEPGSIKPLADLNERQILNRD